MVRKYMIIENFLPGRKDEIYDRFKYKGRMLPVGLYYIDSWLAKSGNQCFQLMETKDPSLFSEWTRVWEDLVSFEIIELGPKPEKID